MRFEEMNLAPEVVQASVAIGWGRPTPLQARAIPAFLAGKDVAICQSSGAGKTAAYLLPAMNRLSKERRAGVRLLVLVPEGDHAEKVFAHTTALCASLSLTCASLGAEGGVGEASIVLASPAQVGAAAPFLADLDLFVVDGLETWVEQGGEESLRGAASQLPASCQRALLSDAATPEVTAMHASLLRDPAVFPSLEGAQVAFPVPPPIKVQLLLKLLSDGTVPPSLVLARSRHRADRLFRALGRKGVKALRIQGRVGRGQRERWSQAMESGLKTFLVAAELDLASYGALAVPSVVYFDTPGSPQGYAGRFQGAFFGPSGSTYIFVGDEEESRLQAIEAAFSVEIPRKTVEGFDYTVPDASSPDADREEAEAEAPPPPKEKRNDRGRRGAKGNRERQRDGNRKGPPSQQRAAQPKVSADLPKGEDSDEDAEDGAQPDYNTDRPLFPGQRPFRWNSFRLSLERTEGGAQNPRPPEPDEAAASDGGNGKGRKRRKRKGRSGPPARETQAPNGQRPAPASDDSQPDSNEGERRLASHDVVARRFNRSARYSSLAGAPIPPKEAK